MKKTAIIALNIASLLVIISIFDPAHSLTLLLLVGLIPGTDIVIPAIDMLAAISTALTVLVLRVTIWQSIRPVFFGQIETRRTTRRQSHLA